MKSLISKWNIIAFLALSQFLFFIQFNKKYIFQPNGSEKKYVSSVDEMNLLQEQGKILEKIEMRAFKQSVNKVALPKASSEELHYRAFRFYFSPGRPSTFNFRLMSTENSSLFMEEDQYHSTRDRIICEISHKIARSIAHFSEHALPCWSVFQKFPKAQHILNVTTPDFLEMKKVEWITGMLRVFESSNISIIYPDNNTALQQTNTTDWFAQISGRGNGWHPNNCYFFSNQADMMSLHKNVLGEDYESSFRQKLPLRVLLVQRKNHTRDLIYADEYALQINATWGNDVEVKILGNPTGSLKDQALPFHNADIIISPHGQHLTNLAFIHPCTSVLELFPINYYLQYYQPFVFAAGGISYEGYPFDRNIYEQKDAKVNSKEARNGPTIASPESILQAFPRLVLSTVTCLKAHNTHSSATRLSK